MMASMGTPSGSSQAGSMMGHWEAGVQNLAMKKYVMDGSVVQNDVCAGDLNILAPSVLKS